MEIMNLMLLCNSLHSLDLIIFDVPSSTIFRKLSINPSLEEIKQVEFIPTKIERALEYGKALSKALSLPILASDRDYSFTFEFYSNGAEHSKSSSLPTKLQEQ